MKRILVVISLFCTSCFGQLLNYSGPTYSYVYDSHQKQITITIPNTQSSCQVVQPQFSNAKTVSARNTEFKVWSGTHTPPPAIAPACKVIIPENLGITFGNNKLRGILRANYTPSTKKLELIFYNVGLACLHTDTKNGKELGTLPNPHYNEQNETEQRKECVIYALTS